MTWFCWISKDMFLDSGGNVFWNTIKETMNFLSSTNTTAGGSERKRDGDIGGTIERYWYHWIWDTRYSEFKVVIAGHKGVVERRTIYWNMSKRVLREVLLEASQKEVIGEVGGEVEGWNHLGSDEGVWMGKTHTVAGEIPANDWMRRG
jgi:hypothetical protein